MLKYEKAIKLLPRNHIDVSYLRSNMAACYMQLGISEYPRAIHECNLALEVTPKYSKALLKRARCYEALNRLDLALRDVGTVLKMEPNNLMAIEIAERVKNTIERHGSRENEIPPIDLVPLPEYYEPKAPKEKGRKKKSNNVEEEKGGVEMEMKRETEDRKADVDIAIEDQIEEKKTEDKLVVEEEKLVMLRRKSLKEQEIIADRFPTCEAVLVKYRDEEGDLVTITTTEELRLAEASVEHGFVKFYIVEIDPDKDPFFKMIRMDKEEENIYKKNITENGHVGRKNEVQSESVCITDWIVQFAQVFKNYAGFDTDAYVDLHEVGMKLYSDAMEETVTSEEAQDLLSTAAEKFDEMAALALFNCGNVHMSRARKKLYFTEDSSGASVLTQQQFEQAKLSWYYAIGNNVDLESWPSTEVLQLYNKAEENMEKGMQLWEIAEEQRVNGLLEPSKIEILLQKMKLDSILKHVSADEAAEQAANTRSQIHVLWGTMLYERSIMEFKLGLPVWHECLEVAVEKFELAGASPTDIAVMIKNHCSNDTASEGLGFNIDEIVQAWNEMYEAKKWQSSIPSFRLEPLLRRREGDHNHEMGKLALLKGHPDITNDDQGFHVASTCASAVALSRKSLRQLWDACQVLTALLRYTGC
ncbi:hypothetical protein DH2020_030757 [Rehmannia glutinosa]|uniref:PB1 domain-containing protein n=1 Tax=Rehmannia glutinosa TaxID=99300 RepID=A0ABR0VJY4_REHGL